MADFSALKTAIQANIRTNGNEEITGAILQDILLSMVTTMGDGAINALAEALAAEVAARQNAVSGEAMTRAEADSQLSGRINAEAQARAEADTQFSNSITAITTRLNEGYVYAGIATPSTNPGTPAGKVFYIALQAGTYTNFSSLTVTQGITILKYNGTAWSKEQLVAIDDVPTAGSNNLVKSGGVYREYMGKMNYIGQNNYNISSLCIGKKVLLRINENTLKYNTIVLNYSTNLQTLVPNCWYLIDFTSYTNSDIVEFRVSSNSQGTFDFISNQQVVEEYDRTNRIWNLETKNVSGAIAGEYYIESLSGKVFLCTGGGAGEVFPNLTDYHTLWHVLRPKETDIFIIDGKENRWDGTKFIPYSTYNEGDVEDISKGTISKELKVTQIDFSNWGYLGNSGEVHTGTSENNYQYSDLIPVEKGDMIVFRGGNMTIYATSVWGYSDNVGSNPVSIIAGGVYPLQETKYVISSDSIKYIRANSYADREHFVRVYPKLKARELYDIIVAQDGTGDYTSLYDAIASIKPIENPAGISPHYSIFVKGGSYEMPQQGGGTLAWYRNLSIIGESKESVIIYNNNGEYTGWDVDNSCLRLAGKVTLRNLTIISRSTNYSGEGVPNAYCVHVDFAASDGDIMEIENCRMYNDHAPCIGIGLKAGFTLKIKSCEIVLNSNTTINQGAVYCHDGNTESSLPQKIELKNNVIVSNKDNAVVLQSVYGKEIKALFVGNAMFSIGTPVVKTSANVTIDQKSCLNNVELQ